MWLWYMLVLSRWNNKPYMAVVKEIQLRTQLSQESPKHKVFLLLKWCNVQIASDQSSNNSVAADWLLLFLQVIAPLPCTWWTGGCLRNSNTQASYVLVFTVASVLNPKYLSPALFHRQVVQVMSSQGQGTIWGMKLTGGKPREEFPVGSALLNMKRNTTTNDRITSILSIWAL